MFLSSLIVKRRDNRRACKPNMLLDAVLSNAIRNIKKDKTISTLTNLSSTQKIGKHDYHKKNNSNYYSRSYVYDDGGTDDDMKLKMNMKGGSRTIPQDNDKENRDINEYMSDVDHFFEKLKNVKVLQHQEASSISNDNDDSFLVSNTSKTGIGLEETSADDLVDNFIETGIVL